MALSVFAYLSVLVIVVVLFSRFNSRRLPDGPRGVPFFGFIPDKKIKLYEQLTRLIPKYGDFFSLNMGGSDVIVLSSPTVIDELVSKRGGKYSSRPGSSAQAKILGEGRILSLQYGDEFRKRRKVVHSLLGMQNAKIFLPYQEYESRQTLKNLLVEPDAFYTEVSRYSTSVTFSLLLGARVPRNDTKLPEAMRFVIEDTFTKLRPGYWWADWFPILNHLPDSLAPWRAEARKTFHKRMEFWSVFYDAIVSRMEKGTAPDSFIKDFLQSPEVVNFSDVARRSIIGELLAAGSETTATSLQWFFKAAVLHPSFVKAAQEELDRVIGPDRLPSWEDQPNLPYLVATVEELHRWASIAPAGIFHATSQDDTYRGKVIPNGTVVICNAHAVHYNSEYYRDPEIFRPERFLPEKDDRSPGTRILPHYAFGVGRRECPGKHVANASLFLLISRLLWAFDIDLGSNPPPSMEVLGGFPVIRTLPFACNIRPRSSKIAEKILAEAEIQDPSLQVEDATQYEEEMVRVMDGNTYGV